MPRNRKTLMQFDLQCLLEPQLWYAIIMIPSWWGRETERRQRAREWRLLRALTTGLLQRQWRLLVLSGAKVDRSSTRGRPLLHSLRPEVRGRPGAMVGSSHPPEHS